MHDIYDVIKNISNIYDSNTAFEVLKDFGKSVKIEQIKKEIIENRR